MTTSTISDSQPQSKRATEVAKTVYSVDQQVKFMNLQAEVDLLLQQLQNIHEQRQATTQHESI